MTKKALAVRIVRTLREKGHEAYFVGGCVRDMVLGKRPSDFDIASNAGPDLVRAYFKETIPVGQAFGVIIVRLGGHSFEVSTFRAESGYKDGRRPGKVKFTDAKEDALRRDFTVNGLYYDPAKKKILDWVSGVGDIRKKVIRTIGDPARRFKEDKLRMLRAVRFTVNLGFKMELRTLNAIRKMRREIRVVSHERVRDELVKMFTGPDPAAALDSLDRSGLLGEVLPEVAALKGVAQPKEFHPEGDVFVHTRLLMKQLKNPSIVLAFGCLLHDIGKPPTFKKAKDRIRFHGHDRVGARMADKLLIRLRFSNELREQIVACVDGHMRFKDAPHMRESTLKKMFQRDTFPIELEQHRIDCRASHGDLRIWRLLRRKWRSLSQSDIRPEPFLKGKDLVEAGFAPGPDIGRILREAELKQLDGVWKTRDEALLWARSLYKPNPGPARF